MPLANVNHHLPARLAAWLAAGSILLAACGGGGGSAPATVLRGQLALQQEGRDAVLGLSGGFDIGRFAVDEEPNDTLLSATDLGTEVSEGGIERSGRLTSSDVRDVYRLGSLAGEPSALSFELTSNGDVELVVLRKRSGSADSASTSDWRETMRMHGGRQTVDARADDDFVIVLSNRSASSGTQVGYRFAIGAVDTEREPVLSSSTTLRPGAEWADVVGTNLSLLPGEIIVGTRDAGGKPDADALRRLGFVPVVDDGPVQRWALPGSAGLTGIGGDAERIDLADRLRLVRRVLGANAYASPNRIAGLDTLAGLQGKGREPNDPLFKPVQWNLQLSRLPLAWATTTGKSDVHIAFMDTGLLVAHPDLSARVSAWSYDFVTDPNSSGDGDGPDNDVSEPMGFETITFFHGTYVAGVACASTDNAVGIAGGVWEGKILALRVFGRLGATSFDLIQAWRYIAGLTNSSGRILPVAERPKVLNMSFAFPNASLAEREAIRAVHDTGVLMFAAVGNEGLNPAPPRYPAALDEVVGVGAVDSNAKRASYSNAADYVEVVAAGGEGLAGPDGVTTTWAFTKNAQLEYVYNSFSGTSLATPLVSAAAALMESVHTGIELPTLRQVLSLSSVDLGAPGFDPEYGFGLLDVPSALNFARDLDRPPFPELNPISFDFGSDNDTTTISIRNSGGRVLRDFDITRIRGADDVFEFRFSSEHAPADLEIKLDRSSLPVGDYADVYRFDSNGGQAVLSLLYRVPIPKAAGKIQINVYSESRFVAGTTADDEGRFEIVGLPAGEYMLQAGVDRNANGRLGDSQEWFLELPVTVDSSKAAQLTGIEIPWKN